MKYKYSINNKNQLLIKSKKDKAPLPVRGTFSVDKKNRLVFWLNETAGWRRLYSMPSKLILEGKWRLTPGYDLELNLNETRSPHRGDRLVFRGEIISCESDALVFEIASQTRRGVNQVRLLKISGSWQADKFNRLVFTVNKKGEPDLIALEGRWQINKNQQIAYNYEKTALKRKKKIRRSLDIKGFWQINKKNRLTYIFSTGSQSRFDLRAQLESPSLYPADGLIKYRVGTGVRRETRKAMDILCLYGEWKFSRKGGLNFRMDYGKGRFQDMEFGANAYLNKDNELAFSLANKEKEPLGIDIIFTRRFLKKSGAEAVVRLKDILDKRERAIEGGVRIPF